jgi:hypothetical protein
MDSGTSHSAGFGRIGAETRSSMYSPYQFRSVSSDAARQAARRREALRKRIATAVLLIAVVAVAALAGLVVMAPPAPTPTREAVNLKPPALDAEAERLDRSAFARQRRRG